MNRKTITTLIIAGIIAVAGVALFFWPSRGNDEQSSTVVSPSEPSSTPEPDDSEGDSEVVVEPIVPLFDSAQLQSTLDQWAAEQTGAASVVVLDSSGEELAAVDKDRVYFAASIYKLYVAYYGYQHVDDGLVDPTEIYVNGHTRAACLDLMIRESDSPCAEKLWVELGKETLTAQLQDIGVQNTSMTDLRTTSTDAAAMLARIARGDGLSEASHAAFLESMKTQVYRDALNAGFSGAVTVYNKIGFRDFDEYHDVAIVELADGRRFILTVLSDGVGTRGIAELGRRIEVIILE